MSTPAKIAANRINAKLSTGPRTPQGKARSSRNAIKFGLFSGAFTQSGEESFYADLRADVHGAFAPQSREEERLVAEIFGAVWRLRRCNQIEAACLTPLERTVRRARGQASRILHKAVADLRQQKHDSHKRTQFPVAA